MSGQHFLPVPASLSHLDLGDIQAALIDTRANVYAAASALGVPTADLRRLTRAHPQLIDTAIEAVEQRLDLAERNLDEALHSDDSRRRDAASYFIIKNTVRSKQRGWIPSSAASVDVALAADLPPRRIVVSRSFAMRGGRLMTGQHLLSLPVSSYPAWRTRENSSLVSSAIEGTIRISDALPSCEQP